MMSKKYCFGLSYEWTCLPMHLGKFYNNFWYKKAGLVVVIGGFENWNSIGCYCMAYNAILQTISIRIIVSVTKNSWSDILGYRL